MGYNQHSLTTFHLFILDQLDVDWVLLLWCHPWSHHTIMAIVVVVDVVVVAAAEGSLLVSLTAVAIW